MSIGSKIANTMTVFGVSCVAPSVHTFNAMAGATTLVIGFGATMLAYEATKPTRIKVTDKISDQMEKTDTGKAVKKRLNKISNSWLGRNFLKASVLGAATIVGSAAALQTYDDVHNDGKDFSIAFSDHVTQPAYGLVRYGVKEALIPVGRWATENINNGISATFNIKTPQMSHDPVFNAHSSFRARCIEPTAKLLLDGNAILLDNYIRGVETPRRGIDREILDSYTKPDVYYQNQPIC